MPDQESFTPDNTDPAAEAASESTADGQLEAAERLTDDLDWAASQLIECLRLADELPDAEQPYLKQARQGLDHLRQLAHETATGLAGTATSHHLEIIGHSLDQAEARARGRADQQADELDAVRRSASTATDQEPVRPSTADSLGALQQSMADGFEAAARTTTKSTNEAAHERQTIPAGLDELRIAAASELSRLEHQAATSDSDLPATDGSERDRTALVQILAAIDQLKADLTNTEANVELRVGDVLAHIINRAHEVDRLLVERRRELANRAA